MVEDPDQVGGEDVEIERPVVVLRVAVAARVPCRRSELSREEFDLRVPRAAVAADAVQEDDERSPARDGEGEPRRSADERRFQAYSALAPEIFTARPRLSKSFFR
jgi:hypothetical protein